ncbi:right-handed parallel beta-helix repeat-containing protein [Galbibacter mesophilus]|uniref:right-handed parallel beta-helix repeat-containing protein n=1 Tax=Galbibacter mesophilus TaxID=379069 RepID=UPI00191D1606|nr:right-handed parallel beta-helix repeat-containing protein [Galbibacter mesophilus]MCM5664035.1 right-handed parallel beta-helix repeat-containing protein [Galbibacter mesophilus]
MEKQTKYVLLSIILALHLKSLATDYYIHPFIGSNENSGLTSKKPFKTLSALEKINFKPGDTIFIAANTIHYGNIEITDYSGKKGNPLVITSFNWTSNKDTTSKAIINFKGLANGLLLENSNNIIISNLTLTGNGHNGTANPNGMSCGVLLKTNRNGTSQNITLNGLSIYDVFNKNTNFQRGANEVMTANGTQAYGWGIRIISSEDSKIKNVSIKNSSIQNVSHTAIKLTGKQRNISEVEILNNHVSYSGGPGIQMSNATQVLVRGNTVEYSGSNNDSRKWGRGSGLWTWSSTDILIEKNKFLFANGPADSSGAHIDFNCNNVIIQYNLSAYNAGGFCEILGNNYNCIYRYNISINDGHRVKGKNGAFQEGKIFWLSGYQGKNNKRKGPVNTYFYNNTIYTNGSYTPKIAIEQSSKGIFIANNIFALKGKTQLVMGDQYNPEKKSDEIAKNIVFSNNLYLTENSWPDNIYPKDQNPIYGDSGFKNEGSLTIDNYIPKNKTFVKQGIKILPLPQDDFRTAEDLNVPKDYLDRPTNNLEFIGAIKP